MSELIIDFIEYLEVERGRSPRTSESYRRYLERFIEFAGDIEVDTITSELVRKYRLWLNRVESTKGGELAMITQAYHLIALRGFLNYLSKRDIESLAPNKIDLPKVHRKQVTFLHFEEVERMLEAIPDDETPQHLRDKAILELLFSSGLRVSELCNLDRDHVNLKRREFMVRGKGQKDRPLVVSNAAANRCANLKPIYL